MIDSMDQAIGILEAVADLGQTEHGELLFLADNEGCDESGLYGFEREQQAGHGQFLCQLRPLLGRQQHAVPVFRKTITKAASLRRSSFTGPR